MHDRAMSSKEPGSLKAYFKTIGERKTSKKRLLLHFEIFLGIMDVWRELMYQTPLSHSALFPLLLLSLTGQKHSPDCSEKINDEYDYIIGKLIIKIAVI